MRLAAKGTENEGLHNCRHQQWFIQSETQPMVTVAVTGHLAAFQ